LVAGSGVLMSDISDLVDRVRAAATGRAGRIRLVSAAFTITQLSIEIAKSLEATHPGIEVEIATAQRPIEDRLLAEQIRSDPRVVLLSERHRLAGRRTVTLADLAEDPVVIVDAFASPAALDHRIVDPRPDGRRAVRGPIVQTLEDCLTQIRRGHGVWFAPRAMAEWALCSGVRLIPVEDIEDTPLAVVWSPNAPQDLVTLLIEHIRPRIDEF
jgi:DNA-binding transcriptional LysR family regulator